MLEVSRELASTVRVPTTRDRAILALASNFLGCARADFPEALRALHEATAQLIVGGRVFYLGCGLRGPIVGSLVSRVGIVEGKHCVIVVRAEIDGRVVPLGPLAP